jgi:hypothetical protein
MAALFGFTVHRAAAEIGTRDRTHVIA